MVAITPSIYKNGAAFGESFFFREIVDIGKKILYLCHPFEKIVIFEIVFETLKRYAVRKKA